MKVSLLPHTCQGLRLLHGTHNKTDCICMQYVFPRYLIFMDHFIPPGSRNFTKSLYI